MAENPQLELYIKSELRLGRQFADLSSAVQERFGIRIAASTLQSYYARRFKPETDAEIEAYRRARAEAHAWIEEMHADPNVDATRIAEVALARQIVAQSGQLEQVDIMQLLQEQRKRQALELRREALEQERQRLQLEINKLQKQQEQVRSLVSTEENERNEREVIRRIREIYGLFEDRAAAAVPAGVDQR